MSPATDRLHWPSRRELLWVAAAAAVVMALTCLPYLVGWALTPPGDYYSGFLANPDEHNVYLSLMRQAHDGSWLFSDLFTAAPQRGLVLNVFWLKAGIFARLTHLSLPVTYHLFRVISGWLLLMALYVLAAQVLPAVGARRAALLLASFASGFGWLFHPGAGQPNPIDFGPGLVMPEAITYLTLLLNPLFAFSVFLLIVVYLAASQALLAGSVRAAVVAGAAALLLGNIHSYDVVPVAVVLAAYLALLLATRRAGARAVLLTLLIAAISAPSLLYQLWLQRVGEVSVLVKAVNQPPSPELRYVLLGFGLPLLLAVVGLVRAIRGNAWAQLLAWWFVLGLLLVYAPLSFQRKLIEGLHVPICLLAMLGIGWIVEARSAVREPVSTRRAVVVVGLVLVLALPSSFFFTQRGLDDLLTNNLQYAGNLMPPLYLSADERAAADYLSTHATRADLVLANSRLASYLPSLSGVRVYFGHWSETPNFSQRIGEFSAFLRASTSDAQRETFVREHGITYVVLDQTPVVESVSSDRLYLPLDASAFDPREAVWLAPEFVQGRVAVYRVVDTSTA